LCFDFFVQLCVFDSGSKIIRQASNERNVVDTKIFKHCRVLQE